MPFIVLPHTAKIVFGKPQQLPQPGGAEETTDDDGNWNGDDSSEIGSEAVGKHSKFNGATMINTSCYNARNVGSNLYLDHKTRKQLSRVFEINPSRIEPNIYLSEREGAFYLSGYINYLNNPRNKVIPYATYVTERCIRNTEIVIGSQ